MPAKNKLPRKPSRPRVVECVICGALFETTHSQGRFCSKECRQEGKRENWWTYACRNRDKRRESSQRIYQAGREKTKARTAAYHKTESGKKAVRVSYLRQQIKSPEKIAARSEVLMAVRKGTLVKCPCEVCGNARSQAHHNDYLKPLEVRWLCSSCHRDVHEKKKFDTQKGN